MYVGANVTLLTCFFSDYHHFSAAVVALVLPVVLATDVESLDEFEDANLNEFSPKRESL